MMNERPEKENASDMERRDKILGGALSNGMGKEAEACPPLEEIALLIDERLEPEEKDRLMSHLAGCENCLQTFIAARELAGGKEVSPRRRWLPLAAAAAAAVLVLALRFTFWSQPEGPELVAKHEPAPPAAAPAAPMTAKKPMPGPEPLSPVEPLVVAMARQVANEAGTAGADKPVARSLGYAVESRPEAVAFRLGAAALDLEVALLSGDQGAALRQTERAASLLDGLGGPEESLGFLAALRRKIEAGAPLTSLVGSSHILAKPAIHLGLAPFWELGAWAEGARDAAAIQNAEFFTDFPAPANVLPVEESEARSILNEIEQIIQAAKTGTREQRILRDRIDGLFSLY